MTSSGLSALGTCDLVVSRGSDNVYQFIWATSDGTTTTPVNLTGYTAKAQMRWGAGGPIWTTFQTSDSTITLDSTGHIIMTLGHAITQDPSWDPYHDGVWDIELTSGSGLVTRVIEGKVTVSQDVTR